MNNNFILHVLTLITFLLTSHYNKFLVFFYIQNRPFSDIMLGVKNKGRHMKQVFLSTTTEFKKWDAGTRVDNSW